MLCPQCWGLQAQTPGPDCVHCNPCPHCSGAGVVEDIQLSEHFRLSEMLASETAVRRHIPNVPGPGIQQNMADVTTKLLEPIRKEFGPIHISSGFRSSELNNKVGGSFNSAHILGKAADISSMDKSITRKMLVDWVLSNNISFDQIIFEGTWVHIAHNAKLDSNAIGAASLGVFQPNRKQALMRIGNSYLPYDPKDPRVNT